MTHPPKIESELVREALGQASHPIFAISFNRDRSHDAQWAIRECVQNLLDGGQRGTLADVNCDITRTKGNKTFFRFQGDWRFDQQLAHALIDLMTTKEEEDAGGMGIGIKQAALVLARDLGGSSLRIRGSTSKENVWWKVEYRIVKAAVINQKLQSKQRVTSDWLVADYNVFPIDSSLDAKTARMLRETCEYGIETDDPNVIAACHDFFNTGVGPQNKYLYGAHVNQPGKLILCWHSDLQHGRVFIQGQVWQLSKSSRTADRWASLRGVSIALYPRQLREKSIDRPPLSNYSLEDYIGDGLSRLSKAVLAEQLQITEPMWTQVVPNKHSWEEDTALVVIKEIVSRLAQQGFKFDSLKLSRPSSAYYHRPAEAELSQSEVKELAEKRQVFACPDFFSEIGMPNMKELIRPEDRAIAPNIKAIERAENKQFDENGATVLVKSLTIKTKEQLVALLQDELMGRWVKQVLRKDATRPRLHLELDTTTLFHPRNEVRSRFQEPTNDEQRLVAAIRNVVIEALGSGVCVAATCILDKTTLAFNVARKSGNQAALFTKTSDEQLLENYLSLEFKSEADCQYTATELSATTISDQQEKAWRRERESRFIKSVKQSSRATYKWLKGSWWDFVLLFLFLGGIAAIVGYYNSANKEKVSTAEPSKGNSTAKSNKTEQNRSDRLTSKDMENVKKMNEDYSKRAPKLTRKQLPGRAIAKIAGDVDQSGVLGPAWTKRQKKLQQQLDRESVHKISYFKVLPPITGRWRRRQIELLAQYVHDSTGVKIDNKLFAFNGSGAKGVNIRTDQSVAPQGIGIHFLVLDKGGFYEGLTVFVHEVVHNAVRGHGNDFLHAQAALHTAISKTLASIAAKLKQRQSLSEREKRIVDAERKWIALQKMTEF